MSMISVIIPVYNAEPYLRRCLNSVLNQTYIEWEAICVDDGSKDYSGNILSEYAEKDARIKVIAQQNGGAAKARNTGLGEAKGEYIFFLDSDDELVVNCLEVLMKEVNKHPDVEMVVGANLTIDDTGNSHKVVYGKPCYVESNEWIRLQFFKDENVFYVVPWNKLIRKDFLIDNGLFFKEGIIHEDDHWSFFLYKQLKNISVLDEDIYFHYVTPTSVMSTRTKEKTAETLLVILSDVVKHFDVPYRSLQVYKSWEYYSNFTHPFLSKRKNRAIYYVFFREFIRMGQYKIACLWLINRFFNYKHYQLYFNIIPKAYKKEVKKAFCQLQKKTY